MAHLISTCGKTWYTHGLNISKSKMEVVSLLKQYNEHDRYLMMAELMCTSSKTSNLNEKTGGWEESHLKHCRRT